MNKRYNKQEFAMDMLMVAGSLLSIFLSVLVFLSPESSPVFFSLIFILSGFVAYGTGTKKLKRKRDFREMLWGVFLLMLAVFLFVMTILSILTL